MAKKNILLVDGENILHQSFHKFEKLKSTDGKPSGAIFGFFKSLHMYITRFNPDDVYVTFDNGHSSVRTKLLPNYKGHRKNIAVDYESLHNQKRQIMVILRCLRIKYIFDKKNINDYEGDDFLAYLALKKFRYDRYKIILVSSDKDFNQLINKDLRIFNPRKEEIIREENCKDIYGYEPKETVDYLSLIGDASDDIPGFPGIGPVKARKFLDFFGSIQGFISYNVADNVTTENKRNAWIKFRFNDKNLQDMKKLQERNMKLIDLNWFINNTKMKELPIKEYTKSSGLNMKKFKEICISYSLSSFLTNNFINIFEQLIKK